MAFTSYPWSNVHELNLDWLIRQIKEVQKSISEFDKARKEFEETAAELRAMLAQLNGEVDQLEKLYSDFVEQINARFANLEDSLLDDLALYKQGIDLQMASFQAEIDGLEATVEHALANLPSEIQMINPVTGEMDSLENIIYALSGQSRTDALTASEYDALDLTATAYDAYDVSAYDYDWHGKTILV